MSDSVPMNKCAEDPTPCSCILVTMCEREGSEFRTVVSITRCVGASASLSSSGTDITFSSNRVSSPEEEGGRRRDQLL